MNIIKVKEFHKAYDENSSFPQASLLVLFSSFDISLRISNFPVQFTLLDFTVCVIH